MCARKKEKEIPTHLLNLPIQFETERLIIRKFEIGDGEGLLNLLDRNHNREFLKDAIDEATEVLSIEDAQIRIR